MLFKLAGCGLILVLLLLTLSGCWERQELSEIAIVLGAGLDKEEDGILLTVELAHRLNGADSGESKIFSAQGRDLQQAEQKLAAMLDKTIFWGQLTLVLFGQGLNEEEQTGYALAFYQDGRLGSAIPMLQCQGRAEDILNAEFGEATYVSQGLVQAMEHLSSEQRQVSTIAQRLEAALEQRPLPAAPMVLIGDEGRLELKGSNFHGR